MRAIMARYTWTRRQVVGTGAGPDTDFTGKVRLRGLRPGERVYYRVRVRVEPDHGRQSEPVTGSLAVPGRRDLNRDFSLDWAAVKEHYR
jgi:alkaline phosphatase D